MILHIDKQIAFCNHNGMSADALTPEESAAAERAERRLALLAEMAQLGMRMLRRLDQSLMNDTEAAEAFARISRAVRLTLALEEKTERFRVELLTLPQRLAQGQGQDQPPEPVDYALQAHERRKAALRERKANAFDLLVAVSESEGESLESVEKLFDAVAETIDEAESAARGDRALEPMIETVCARLGLGPELSSRVAEGFECGYLAGRPRFNPWPQSAVAVQAPP